MNIENTIREIYELMETCKYKKAKKLSKKLIREDIIDGYYLLTTVYDKLNRTEKCIETLNTGLEKYPNDWILWMRLANYQSDLNEYDAALGSYNKALDINDADKDYINLNLAILYNRWGKLEHATKTIDKVSTDRYEMKKLSGQLSIFIAKEDYQEVLNSWLNDNDRLSETNEADHAELSLIQYFYAVALWRTDNIPKAKDCIKQSLTYNRQNPQTYWLIREMNNDYSDDNNYFRMLITGDWLGEDDKHKKYRFFSSYDIVADSEQKALNLIKEFETAPIDKDSLKIDESEEIEFNPKEHPSGIYYVNGFSIFEDDE